MFAFVLAAGLVLLYDIVREVPASPSCGDDARPGCTC